MLKTRLYLAGPMRGYKDFNFPAFIEATKKLREAGYIVSCPAEMDRADGFNEEVLARMSDKEVMEYTRRVFPRDAISVCGSDGIALLETLNIDNELFCRVFNEYGETDFKQYHSKADEDYDSTKLFNLIQSGIGSGYWMLKGSGKGSDFYEITEAYSKQASTPTGKPNVLYGGSDGMAKRVDITFESNEYFFKVNIRNKQGGLYPSHIMCDYKKK